LIMVNLRRAGHHVHGVADAESALLSLADQWRDLVLIDWGLPGMSGIELTQKLRASVRTRSIAILLLTARSDEKDKVTALDAGADDYITKPFSPRELIARVLAVLRRRRPHAIDGIVEWGAVRLDLVAARITVAGMHVAASSTEFHLLHFLMSRPNHVHSRATLIEHVWGDSQAAEEHTVDRHMRSLRALLAKAGLSHVIRAVRGGGYVVMTDLT
jgi:two-component system phosphate regulon response regulator PhoB